MLSLQNYTKILNAVQTFLLNFFKIWFKFLEEMLKKFRRFLRFAYRLRSK